MSARFRLFRSSHSPDSSSARRSRRRWQVGGTVLVGGLLVVVGPTAVSRPLVQLGLPLLLIAGLLYWRLRRWRRREAGHKGPYWLRIAKRMWRPRGSGFYALVAAVTFLALQGDLLFVRSREAWATWWEAPYADGGAFVEFLSGQLWNGVVQVIVAVSAKTVLNVVWAGLWPLSWVLRYGVLTTLGTILLAYALYRGARARFPAFDAVMQQIDGPEEADRGPEEGADPEKEGTPDARSVPETASGRR